VTLFRVVFVIVQLLFKRLGEAVNINRLKINSYEQVRSATQRHVTRPFRVAPERVPIFTFYYCALKHYTEARTQISLFIIV
jgi:hypothetical protein